MTAHAQPDAPPALRILSARATALGSEGALENVSIGKLADGCVAWVNAEAAFYYLEKSSVEPVSYPNVIPTLNGALSPGRWKKSQAGNGSIVGNQEQFPAAASWTINHNLNRRPHIVLMTLGGLEIEAEILHTSLNQAVVYFDAPIAGIANWI